MFFNAEWIDQPHIHKGVSQNDSSLKLLLSGMFVRSWGMIRMDATYHLSGGFKPRLKRFADLDGPDFFPTPAWATHALIDNERFDGDIWESACGNGAMSRVLETTGQIVVSSDLYDRGYGESGHDFLKPYRRAENIITNPPFNAAEGFVSSCLKQANRK